MLDRYPDLPFVAKRAKTELFNRCIGSSTKVSEEFLKIGINIFLTRNINKGELIGFPTFDDMMGYLADWVSWDNEDYVEVVIVIHEDGTSSIFRDYSNTTHISSYPDLVVRTDGKTYYEDLGCTSPVKYIAHTHRGGKDPSPEDVAGAEWCEAKGINIDHAIYYNGTFNVYHERTY